MADEGWQPGDLVRVLSGPFAELTGTVEEVHADRSTLRVYVSVMGSGCHVEVDFDDVAPYDPDNWFAAGGRWQRGASVRVLSGPFQYLTGVVQSANDATERVVVRLTGLRPEVCVEFTYHDVESV